MFSHIRIVPSQSLFQVDVQGTFELELAMLQGRVPVVLDGVVAAADQYVLELGPVVLLRLLHNEKNPAFFLAPRGLPKKRIQLVVPAFPTLLARAHVEGLSNVIPLVCTKFRNGCG